MRPLVKKVIYIDQFAISNMMKALNTAMESHARTAAEPFWLELFEILERLCKLQLVVCPYSSGHQDESLLSGAFGALKRMYEHLSHGLAFDSFERIAQVQMTTAALAWARGETPTYDLDPRRVTSGGLHDWQERLLITVDMEYPQEIVDDIRRIRDEIFEQTQTLFERLRSSGPTTFDYHFTHEAQHGARAILEAHQNYIRHFQDAALRGDFQSLDPPTSLGHDRFLLITNALERAGIEGKAQLPRLAEFLLSDTFRDAPANRIQSLMWAVLAHRAANSGAGPPNRGMVNDINAVSSLLPYCDALFVDNECRGILANIPRAYRLPYPAQVFSPRTRDQFIQYLRAIEAQAHPGAQTEVLEVYGEQWLQPYLTMYEEERKRQ